LGGSNCHTKVGKKKMKQIPQKRKVSPKKNSINTSSISLPTKNNGIIKIRGDTGKKWVKGGSSFGTSFDVKKIRGKVTSTIGKFHPYTGWKKKKNLLGILETAPLADPAQASKGLLDIRVPWGVCQKKNGRWGPVPSSARGAPSNFFKPHKVPGRKGQNAEGAAEMIPKRRTSGHEEGKGIIKIVFKILPREMAWVRPPKKT